MGMPMVPNVPDLRILDSFGLPRARKNNGHFVPLAETVVRMVIPSFSSPQMDVQKSSEPVDHQVRIFFGYRRQDASSKLVMRRLPWIEKREEIKKVTSREKPWNE
jgi:hypothetical protein